MLNLRTGTLARWANDGRLTPLFTPGGHRRYLLTQIRRVLAEHTAQNRAEGQFAEDAVRLYNEGWTIRQVADKFGLTYGVMRRILKSRTTLRSCGGQPRTPTD